MLIFVAFSLLLCMPFSNGFAYGVIHNASLSFPSINSTIVNGTCNECLCAAVTGGRNISSFNCFLNNHTCQLFVELLVTSSVTLMSDSTTILYLLSPPTEGKIFLAIALRESLPLWCNAIGEDTKVNWCHFRIDEHHGSTFHIEKYEETLQESTLKRLLPVFRRHPKQCHHKWVATSAIALSVFWEFEPHLSRETCSLDVQSNIQTNSLENSLFRRGTAILYWSICPDLVFDYHMILEPVTVTKASSYHLHECARIRPIHILFPLNWWNVNQYLAEMPITTHTTTMSSSKILGLFSSFASFPFE